MHDYVNDYLSYIKDEDRFTFWITKSRIVLTSKNSEFISLSNEPDILSFIDMLGTKHDIKISYISPSIDGGTYTGEADYSIFIKNTNIYFQSLTIEI